MDQNKQIPPVFHTNQCLLCRFDENIQNVSVQPVLDSCWWIRMSMVCFRHQDAGTAARQGWSIAAWFTAAVLLHNGFQDVGCMWLVLCIHLSMNNLFQENLFFLSERTANININMLSCLFFGFCFWALEWPWKFRNVQKKLIFAIL